MIFLHPLWLFPIPIVLILWWLVRIVSENDDWRNNMHPKLLAWFKRGSRSNRRIPALLLNCLVLLALASPAIKPSDTETQAAGSDIFAHATGWLLLLDISKSMTLDDVAPSRLSAMRDTALEISQQAGATPVGLIIYAGDAFLVSPPAIDKRFLEEKLATLDFGAIKAEGSNPTRAVALASSVLQGSDLLESRVIILGDGGGLNTRVSPAIASLASAGHRTDLIVFGHETPAGEAAITVEDMEKLIHTNGGNLVHSNAFGQVDISELELHRSATSDNLLSRGTLSLVKDTNLSHWLLLLSLPFFLWQFYRIAS